MLRGHQLTDLMSERAECLISEQRADLLSRFIACQVFIRACPAAGNRQAAVLQDGS